MSDLSDIKLLAQTHSTVLEKMAELQDRMLSVERKAHGDGDPAGRVAGPAASIGDQFVKAFEQHREMFGKTRSLTLELKAAADPVTTSSGRNLLSGSVGSPMGNVIGFQNALPARRVMMTSAAEYSRMTGVQGAAGVQAGEGAAKAAVRPDHSLITQTALTVAGYTKMSKQALTDSAELRAAINMTLMRSVGQALDVALVDGGTGFTGGYAALATASTSTVYENLADAASEAVAGMQTAGFAPDVVVMSPETWLGLTVARSTLSDEYLTGNYLGQLPTEMRGLRVVLSPTVDAGKCMVMDSMHSELLVSDAFQIEMGYTGDDFTKNLCVIRAELRVIPVFRTTGSLILVTPKAPA